jgi:hypothetical protein
MSRFLWRCQKFSKDIGIWSLLSLYILKKISILLGRDNRLDVSRFYTANRLPYSIVESTEDEISKEDISLAIVSSEKDFDLLPYTIPLAIDALGKSYSGETRLVVPSSQIETCLEKLSILARSDIQVLSEDLLIDEDHRIIIRNKFQNRYGWALQQFLKLTQVLQSLSSATLVLDADTLLLHPRKWFDENSKQILFPSWEFNPPYYELLSRHGIGKKFPEFTFVTHHMIMQKSIILESFSRLEVNSIQELIKLVVQEASNEESAFCIEYELYGQYIASNHPNSYFIEKWSNRSVSKKELIGCTSEDIKRKYCEYASISAHDYLGN